MNKAFSLAVITLTQIILLFSSSILCVSICTIIILYITVELLRIKEIWFIVLIFELGAWLFIFGIFYSISYFILLGIALELNVWVSVWVSHYSAFKSSRNTRIALFLSIVKVTQVVLFVSLEESLIIWLLIIQIFCIFILSSNSVAGYIALSTSSYLALSLTFNEDDIIIRVLTLFYCLRTFFFILALERSSSILLLFVWIYSLRGIIKYIAVESHLLSIILLSLLFIWVYAPWIAKKEETIKISSRSWLVVLLLMFIFILLV